MYVHMELTDEIGYWGFCTVDKCECFFDERKGDTMDIISMLMNDHRKVEQLFMRYEDGVNQTAVGGELVKELEMHTKIEETILYPKVCEFDEVLATHSKEEHDEVDGFMADFKADYTNTEVFYKIKESVTHHVAEEESEMFPAVKEHCSEEELTAMGDQAQAFKDDPNNAVN